MSPISGADHRKILEAVKKKNFPKKTAEQDDPDQSARFLADAEALGVDKTGRAFRRAVKAVIPRKDKPSSKKPAP